MAEQEDQTPQPVSIYEMLIMVVDQTAAMAWQKLGLQPDMRTGQIHQDMAEAKVAIDITTHLSTFIEPKLDEEDKRELHNLIRNLRMNYVQKSQGESS
ncbi:MAG TPA: DUF1844 domain-containing protein [Fimbriimonadaceae bacterium]|jgi:uncharacterized protein YbgA (DUF1722 family)